MIQQKGIVLMMEFFISSGSAKAFMMIPLIVPLAQQFGISAQLCIVAFAEGVSIVCENVT